MLHINTFGTTFLIDKSTDLILLNTKSNEAAKFISSAILDTYAAQLPTAIVDSIPTEWLTNHKKWILFGKDGKLSESKILPSLQNIENRKIAYLILNGYFMLSSNATLLGTSFDNLSDLNSEDLALYSLHKERYIKEYAIHKNIDTTTAKKHLDFLEESLLDVQFRKQTLMWRYGDLLKKIKSASDLEYLKSAIINEVRVGKV